MQETDQAERAKIEKALKANPEFAAKLVAMGGVRESENLEEINMSAIARAVALALALKLSPAAIADASSPKDLGITPQQVQAVQSKSVKATGQELIDVINLDQTFQDELMKLIPGDKEVVLRQLEAIVGGAMGKSKEFDINDKDLIKKVQTSLLTSRNPLFQALGKNMAQIFEMFANSVKGAQNDPFKKIMPQTENVIKKSKLMALIRETVEEVMQIAPLGVAEAGRIEEGGPPNFPKKLRASIIAKYKKKYPNDEERANKAAFGTMWKIFYEKKKGNKKINEMWTAFESQQLNEVEQDEEHDETDMNNPEEAREVELATQVKAAAEEILKMHGVESEEDEGEEESENSEENK